MPGDDHLLHPPMAPSTLWWLVVAALVALALVLAASVAMALRGRRPAPAGLTVEDRRAGTLAAIDAVAEGHRRGEVATTIACQRLGRLVRRFIGECSGVDAEALTADELMAATILDHRLEPAALFVTTMQRGSFAPGADVDVTQLTDEARTVVTQWT